MNNFLLILMIAFSSIAIAQPEAASPQQTVSEYSERVHMRIKRFLIVPPNVTGNPEVVFDVTLAPDGNPMSIKLNRSSGNAAYDQAVERAILKASPLPQPPANAEYKKFRDLTLTIRLQ
jgi:colicin import membrane protein